jgi:hypothetical protein
MKDIVLTVKNVVKSTDPYNKGVETTSFYVELKDLPSGLPVDTINTRKQNINQSIYKKIIDGAISSPNQFHLKNSGMLIFSRKCVSIGENKLKLTLGQTDGVGDGGHTYKCIQEANKLSGGIKNGFVRIQVISGLETKSQKKVCLARNTSIANTESTIFNHNGHYDSLKKAFSELPYFGDIAFKQNEKKPIDVRLLVSILSIFVYDKNNLRDCYFNKSKVLRFFVDNKEKYSETVKNSGTIFSLYDLTKTSLSEIHEKEQNSKIGSKYFSQKKTGLFDLKFSENKIKYNPHELIVFLTLSNLRGKIGAIISKKDVELVKKTAKAVYLNVSENG